MLKGFRDFIMRGNVIDLAVAVVIGAAFTALVNAVVTGFIDPLVRSVLGGDGETAGTFEFGGQTFDYGVVINAVITFLITAAVVYFVFVAPMNHLKERRVAKLGEAPEADPVPDDIALLTEIRDLLAKGRGSSAGPGV